MPSSSRSDSDVFLFDVELSHIEERCRELRKEKDLLKETQSQSFDLIKRLDLHFRKLNEARLKDKKQIQDLQRELNNCHLEIDYLQDQLNEKNAYTDSLEEHVSTLNVKVSDIDRLQQEIVSLREEVEKSNSQCEFLMQELETKETEITKSCLRIEKLEESIASTALEYQFELESMRLEMMSLKESIDHRKSRSEFNRETLEVSSSCRVDEYESMVKKLKDELKEQKLRAKEESEDLAQEMAELRYQLTELLEEERKRRSCIEQASLLRISQLEAQLQLEQQKFVAVSRGIGEP